VSFDNVAGLIASVLVVAYLVAALIVPERF
jgi:K+-transporting ATPase KdpF subunit